MENENPVPAREGFAQDSLDVAEQGPAPLSAPPPREPWETRALLWIFWGPNRLRAGWSIICFLILVALLATPISAVLVKYHLIGGKQTLNPLSGLIQESVVLIPAMGAAAILALIERRRGSLLAYNLLDRRWASHFAGGLAAGFLALSLLVCALYAGHWVQFGPVGLSGTAILKFAGAWAVTFLAVAAFEEGVFRCYLQATLTRGLNFWWALAWIAPMCALLLWRGKGNGVWGVYLIAALGLVPCFLLHMTRASNSGFWQATWVTSTLFGMIHTGNNGENWIGIFAAAAVGFVFCVSIRVTGSAWWAVGCHLSWDWAETYFYGTADSGAVATGHFLSATPAGNPIWSGGTDGPEGSVLVLPVLLVLLLWIVVQYGRKRPVTAAALNASAAG